MTTNQITLSLFELGLVTTAIRPLQRLTGTDGLEIYKPSQSKSEPSVDEMFAQLEANDPRAAAAIELGTKWVAENFLSGRPLTLATLRMRAGLSQRELGTRLGVSQPMIAKWEKGDIPSMQLRTLMSLAEALSMDVKELIDILLGDSREQP